VYERVFIKRYPERSAKHFRQRFQPNVESERQPDFSAAPAAAPGSFDMWLMMLVGTGLVVSANATQTKVMSQRHSGRFKEQSLRG